MLPLTPGAVRDMLPRRWPRHWSLSSAGHHSYSKSKHVRSHRSCCWQVQSTVSHWNLIHLACHEAARRADASLRTAKSEWEGAALRNGGTLANNLLPVSISIHFKLLFVFVLIT